VAPDHFSVSQLTTYLACPRKWRLRYIDEVEPERTSADLVLGGAVHSAIEWWQTARIEGREVDLAGAQRIFRADWDAGIAAPKVEFNGSTSAEMRILGAELVRLFVEHFTAQPPPEAVEERFEVALRDPATGMEHGLPLVGYQDYVAGEVVGEIKTASRKQQLSNWDLQLAAYSYAHRETTGCKPRLQVVQLVKTKEPKLEVTETEISDEQEAWFLEVAISALGSIESGAFHPTPSWMCPRCEYRRACRGR